MYRKLLINGVRHMVIVLAICVVFLSFDIRTFAYGGDELYREGFIRGTSSVKKELNEDGAFTREQLAYIILEMHGEKDTALKYNYTPRFEDQSEIGSWAMAFIGYNVEKGLMTGVGRNRFNPKGVVTGRQLAIVLLSAMGYSDLKWETVDAQLRKLGIPIENVPLTRGMAFDYIWDVINLPICVDGEALIDKLRKNRDKKVGVDDVRVYAYDKMFGLEKKDGTALTDAVYDYIAPQFKDGLIAAAKGYHWRYLNPQGEEICAQTFHYAYDFKEGMGMVERLGKHGFVDKNGNVVVEPDYYWDARSFHNGFAWVFRDGKVGYIDKSGREVVPLIYDDLRSSYEFVVGMQYDFEGGLAMVAKDGKYGFVNESGKEVVPTIYDDAASSVGGIAIVVKNGMYGGFDRNGNLVIPFEYSLLLSPSDGLIMAEKNDKVGYLDLTGAVAIPFIYEAGSSSFEGGFALVNVNGYNGIINKRGEYVVEPRYVAATLFRDDLAFLIDENQKLGAVDTTGYFVIPLEYDTKLYLYRNMPFFNNGLIALERGGLHGFLDIEGTTRIPFEYESAFPFSDGLAAVMKGGKWGFIDKNGHLAIPFQFDGVNGNFSYGLCGVRKGDKWGYINKKGRLIIPYQFDSVREFEEYHVPIAEAVLGEDLVVIDQNGIILTTYPYEYALGVEGGILKSWTDPNEHLNIYGSMIKLTVWDGMTD